MNREDFSCIYYDIIKPNAYFPRPIRIMESITSTPKYDSVGIIVREPCYDFHYIISGTGELWYEGKTYTVGPGQGFIWFQDDTRIQYRYPKNAKEPWRFISFCFMQEQILPTIISIIENSSPVFNFTGDEPFIKMLFKNASAKERITLSGVKAAEMVYNLILTLMNSASTKQDFEFHPVISRVKRIIEAEIQSNINVYEIADRVNLTREYLSRVFKEYTGIKLKDYIVNERIKASCRYLSESQMTVQEISSMMNYSSPSNFSRDFLRVMGMSPNEYRNNKKLMFF